MSLYLIYFIGLSVIKFSAKVVKAADALNFWVAFDVSRIVFLASFILFGMIDYEYGVFVMYFVLTLHSWMGILENLRIFDTY
jgi:hypothetical protein